MFPNMTLPNEAGRTVTIEHVQIAGWARSELTGTVVGEKGDSLFIESRTGSEYEFDRENDELKLRANGAVGHEAQLNT